MFIKMIGSLLLFLGSSAYGCYLEEQLKKKWYLLMEYERLLYFLTTEIESKRGCLKDAFCVSSSKTKGLSFQFGKNMEEKLEKDNQKEGKGIEEIWKEEWDNLLKGESVNLTDREKECIYNGGKYLSANSMETQLKNLWMLRKEVQDCSKEAKEYSIKNGRLYRYFGIMTGLLLVVLLL